MLILFSMFVLFQARTPSYMSGTSSYASSRRSSEDSTDALDLRELRSSLGGRDLKVSTLYLKNVDTDFIYCYFYNENI